MLLGTVLESEPVSYQPRLFNNRAVVIRTPVPEEGDLPPVTESTALQCGWAWRIPLMNKISWGYVYSADYTSQEAAERELREHIGESTDGIEPLNIIGNVAPMIGLFGTVYGMILAFREIVVAGGSPDPVELAAGIGTALTTTFWGLVVAIPALAGYALLRTRLDGLTAEAARSAEELVGRLRDQTLGAEGAPGASTGVA